MNNSLEGYVYLIYDPINERVKIGVSKNPNERCARMARKEHQLSLMCQWLSPSPYDDEAALHYLFQGHRCGAGSEWFKAKGVDKTVIEEFFATPRYYDSFKFRFVPSRVPPDSVLASQAEV